MKTEHLLSIGTGAGILVILLVSATLSLLTIESCSEGDHGGTNVSGTITDSLGGTPLVGGWFSESASDTIHFNRVYADSSGRYSWVSFGRINRQVYAGKSGYQTKSTTLGATSGTMLGVDFQLVRDNP